jgi:demethylmenaquinone methyltransferase/2-methoxy-6-polyprenyl-1,4-benzoquinol methylase
LFSSDKNAYSYLSDSAAAFPYGEVFNNKLRKVGFTRVQDHPQTFGVVTIYQGTKNKDA